MNKGKKTLTIGLISLVSSLLSVVVSEYATGLIAVWFTIVSIVIGLGAFVILFAAMTEI